MLLIRNIFVKNFSLLLIDLVPQGYVNHHIL